MKQPTKFDRKTERRAFGRRNTFKQAIVQWPDSTPLECIVTNESEIGALLTFRETPVVPDQFDLIIVEEDKLFASRRIYQTDEKIGVEFVSLPRRASRPRRHSELRSDAVNAIARDY